jgi:hypothetical protein
MDYGGRIMTKTLYSSEGYFRKRMNIERLKLILGSNDKNFVLFISYRNLLKRIKGRV